MTLPMDIRLAVEGAKMGFVFTRRGIVPETLSSYFLPRLVGVQTALEWTMTGRVFTSEEAHARGLKFGLKNATDIIPQVRGLIDYYVNEQCHQYDEAGVYSGVRKPVFNIEYRPLQRGTHRLLRSRQPGELFDLREGLLQQHLQSADHASARRLHRRGQRRRPGVVDDIEQ